MSQDGIFAIELQVCLNSSSDPSPPLVTVLSLVVVLGVAWCATALYDAGDDVVELTESNFQRLVLQGDEVWMVEFYAPW